MHHDRVRKIRRGLAATALAAALAMLAFPAQARAQQGSVTGTVTGPDAGALPNAEVQVVGTRLGTLTDRDGTFRLEGVPAGTHRLRVRQVGYSTRVVEGVQVRADEVTRVEVVLEQAPYEMGELVVSATRRPERITEAPATVTQISSEEIQATAGNSYSGALREVPGLTYTQVGVASASVNARGFNTSFNNRMLNMIDGRVGILPESGLPVGQFTTIPKVDLASVEVLVGPGASLYGQNASNGVVTLESKDPREYPGTTVEMTGGSRSYFDFQLRHAGTFGDGEFGYKFAGERLVVDDFRNQLVYAAQDGTAVPEVPVDWTNRVSRAEGAFVWYPGDARLEFAGGWSQTDGVGQTNVGRNQLQDWTYDFQQIRFSNPNWYATVYRTESLSKETFALNQFTLNQRAFPGLPEDSVERLSDFPSESQLYAAEVQNNFRIEPLLNTLVTWGGQYRYDEVSSKEQWLTDRVTGEPIGIDQGGAYVQTETPLTPELSVILGTRWDDHQDYESQWSPQAALTFDVGEDQTIRASWRKAYKPPTTLQTRFSSPNFQPFVGVFGNRNGFTVRNANTGEAVLTVDPLVPETNSTWEVGYRGIVGERLYLDVTGYHANYENFISPLQVINNFAGDPPTLAFDDEGEPIVAPNGDPQIVLTYRNLGEAQIWGADVGARYAVSSDVNVKATVSILELSDVEGVATPAGEEATALNAPPVTWTLGTDFSDVFGRLSGGLLLRHQTGYPFASGVNAGAIPTFNTVNAHLAYDLPVDGLSLRLRANNLFTCRKLEPTGGITAEPVGGPASELDGDTSCGFDEGHIEMVNMPEQEATVFAGFRWSTD